MLTPEQLVTDEQDLIDRGICGVIAQGYLMQGVFQRHSIEVATDQPCRCLVGHMLLTPVGERLGGTGIGSTGSSDFRGTMTSIHDNAVGLEDLRHRLSDWMTERGLDDSCCWWEVHDSCCWWEVPDALAREDGDG